MLAKGGNAVDAALAAAIALTVVEPTNNGIGSDAFAVVWDGDECVGLNGSGRSPAGFTADRFEGLTAMPALGWDAVTVPGAVSAWVELSRRFGKLPFWDLFQPAIRYAREGFVVTPVIAKQWEAVAGVYAEFEEFCATFLPDGRAPRAGERFRCQALAVTLELIAETNGDAFYKELLAAKIAAAAEKQGGALDLGDLQDHRAEWCSTLTQPYGEAVLHELPPNGQGLAALVAMGILSQCGAGEHELDGADFFHVQIEAMKLALADTYRYVADPSHMELGAEVLLAQDYLAERAAMIDMTKAGDPGYGSPKGGDTVYLAAGDAEGMMVSFIQSNYFAFGSGVVIPGTGISMQNRGFGFSLEPDHPNRVGPRKRPFHTIIPGFVTSGGKALMAFGVMGGPMQAQGHVQMMTRIIDHDQNPQTASDAPRWQVSDGLDVMIEKGVAASVLEELEKRGHRLAVMDPMQAGGAQLVYRSDGAYIAGSDHRKDGQAVGF